MSQIPVASERKNHKRGVGMSDYRINIRLLPTIFLLLMLIMHYSCVENISEPESENIEIRFHDGYLNYSKEIKEINKSKRFSIIAISLSILLILFLQ